MARLDGLSNTCWSGDTNTASLQEFRRKNALVIYLMISQSRGETNIRAVIKNFRKEPSTFGRHARQRHTKTSRNHKIRRNAAGDPALRPAETLFQLCPFQHHLLPEHDLCPWRQHCRRLHHQHTTTKVFVLRKSVIFHKRVAVEGVNVLAKTSTSASRISSSFIILLSSIFASSTLCQSSLTTR